MLLRVFLLSLTLFLLSCESKKPDYLVGAHYYSWFPENWKAGIIGDFEDPKVKPTLGKYISANDGSFKAHERWAKESGIDFFIFDWWPTRRDIKARIKKSVGELEELKFSIHFETLALKEPYDKPYPGENPNILLMTKEREERLIKHVLFLAEDLMKHPRFLKVDNKPVIFFYVTRHVVGDFSGAIKRLRREIKDKTGLELFIVGDEVFFNVLKMTEERGIHLLDHHEPDWERISSFDALTTYNPYDSSKRQHADPEVFLKDVRKLYKKYSHYAQMQGKPFIPTVLPGYDDRGVRPKENHYVIPRKVGDKSFFKESIKQTAFPFVDPKLKMFTITSWNEWNEGTQIEPATSYGEQHLEELKAILAGDS